MSATHAELARDELARYDSRRRGATRELTGPFEGAATMTMLAQAVAALVALLHVYFLVLEMFLWTKPAGRRAFGTTPEFAEASRTLAANQGLYNGFLAAGLLWGLSLGDAGRSIVIFFLVCVAIAGIYGGVTASRKIIYVQALPALLGLLLTLLARP